MHLIPSEERLEQFVQLASLRHARLLMSTLWPGAHGEQVPLEVIMLFTPQLSGPQKDPQELPKAPLDYWGLVNSGHTIHVPSLFTTEVMLLH